MNNLKIEHIGIVTNSIANYLKNSIYEKPANTIFDEKQNADICFIQLENLKIELIEPKGPNSPTYNFLEKTGGGIHHICYETKNIETVENLIKEKKLLKIGNPSKTSDGEYIWVYSKNKELIEFFIPLQATT